MKDTYTNGCALDILGPDVFVQTGIDSDIIVSHFSLGKLADVLDSAFLESNVVHSLGQVNK